MRVKNPRVLASQYTKYALFPIRLNCTQPCSIHHKIITQSSLNGKQLIYRVGYSLRVCLVVLLPIKWNRGLYS